MAADEFGNDIGAVGVALTGMAAIAPFGTEIPTAVEGAAETLALPAAFKKVGLRTEDGAPEWTEEPDGDPIQFFEDGYTIASGKANVTVKMILAETSRLVDELRSGNEFDANGYIEVSVATNTKEYALFTETVYANDTIVRQAAEKVTVLSVKTQKDTRGEVTGHEVEFKVHRINGKHYGKWLIRPEAAA